MKKLTAMKEYLILACQIDSNIEGKIEKHINGGKKD